MRAASWIVLVAAAAFATVAGGVGCSRTPPGPIAWMDRVEPACRVAAAENRRVLLVFWASWDVASADLDRRAFADPRVRALVAERYVPLRVDRSSTYMQDPDPNDPVAREAIAATARFSPYASKYATVLVLAPDCATELDRFGALPAEEMAERLGRTGYR